MIGGQAPIDIKPALAIDRNYSLEVAGTRERDPAARQVDLRPGQVQAELASSEHNAHVPNPLRLKRFGFWRPPRRQLISEEVRKVEVAIRIERYSDGFIARARENDLARFNPGLVEVDPEIRIRFHLF